MDYRYVVFEDEEGRILIVRDILVKGCVFANMVGNVREIDRGILVKSEADNDYLRAYFSKQKEYEEKRYEPLNYGQLTLKFS